MLQLLKVSNILITSTMRAIRAIISSLYYQLHNLKVWSTITT